MSGVTYLRLTALTDIMHPCGLIYKTAFKELKQLTTIV